MADKIQQINKNGDNAKSSFNITVIPEEFKIKPPQKSNKKLYIFGGIFLGFIIIVIVAFALYIKFSTPNISTPTVESPIQEETLEQPTATTTVIKEEPSNNLFKVPATTTPISNLPVPPEIPIGSLVTGTDSDGDGLTDKEEAIFQTSFKTPDTDGDSFYDGNEVFNLYNPAAHAPTTMLESGIVKLYKNNENNYEVFYPTLWSSGENEDTGSVILSSSEEETIIITVSETMPSISLRSWYKTEFPDYDVNRLQTYTSKNGYSGLQDEARLNTYIKEGGKVFIISYNLANQQTVWFRSVYGMILNSLKIN